MMLTKTQVNDAVRYNVKQVGTLYNVADLGWPWSTADSYLFVWATAFFQKENNLTADGKLGKQTLAKIKKAMDDTSVEVPMKPKPEASSPEKPDGGYSNAIIVNGERVRLPQEFIDANLTASNYLDDGEVHFLYEKRGEKVVNFVLHETCGNTAAGCQNTLLKKNYGVQLILDPIGHLSCHGDLILEWMIHANQLNKVSFGVEIVNPYNPIYVRNEKMWSNTIPKQWWTWVPSLKVKGKVDKGIDQLLRRKGWTNVPRKYVTPTAEQMVAIRLLAPWLCEITGVPYRFPTKDLNKKKSQIEGLSSKPRGRPGPGVVAHRDFAPHSDGRYILENLIESKV